MTGNRRHVCNRLIGVVCLMAGLLLWPPPALRAQSADAPPAERPAAPVERSPSDAKPKTEAPKTEEAPPKREQSYRRQKDNLKQFAPSEEIRVDKAVDFPADI